MKINFSNTEIAFFNRSDKKLKKMALLFSLMNKSWLTNVGSQLGLLALKLRLPFVEPILRNTIFEQFCGGENLLDCQPTIDNLAQFNTLTVLDYGAEGENTEADLDIVMKEIVKAIEMAASNGSVPVVSTRLTGLIDNNLLMKIQDKEKLNSGEERGYKKLVERVETICKRAKELKISIFIDAEESCFQDIIDDVANLMMEKHNQQYIVVYNTYQLYRHDKLAQLKADHKKAKNGKYILGAKLVRGAYYEKENERAKEMGYPTPIHPNKDATDRAFDAAIEYCLHNYETIASYCATHNIKSNKKQAMLINELGIAKKHKHINFCQLYGMGDNITFNIANAGYNVSKYVPYGPLKKVVPYLIRRAQENSSVTGEMSRELDYINTEIKRRGL